MNRTKWLTIGLAVSLIVNLALVGFVAGRISRVEFRPMIMDPMRGFGGILRDLPEERRESLGPLFQEQLNRMRSSARDLRDVQERLNQAVTAEPFHRERLDAALGEFRTHLLESQERSHVAFADLVAALTPEERAQVQHSLTARRGPPGGFGRPQSRPQSRRQSREREFRPELRDPGSPKPE